MAHSPHSSWLASVLLAATVLVKTASATTEYVTENNTIAVTSVSPCHLYGDADIYGIGVRLSLYIQWGAGVIAIAFRLTDELKSIRRGFATIALAVLINGYATSQLGGFVLFDWFMIGSLVFFLAVYISVPIDKIMIVAVFDSEKLDSREAFHEAMEESRVRIQRDEEARGRENGDLDERGEEERDISEGSLRSLPNNKKKRESLTRFVRAPYRWEVCKEDPWGFALIYLTLSAWSCFQPWLYFTAVEQGHRPGCEVQMFLTLRWVDIYSAGYIGFSRGVAIASLVCVAIFYLPISVKMMVQAAYKTMMEELSKDSGLKKKRGDSQKPKEKKEKKQYPRKQPKDWTQNEAFDYALYYIIVTLVALMTAFGALLGVIVIPVVELTIQRNKVDFGDTTLQSTGQLLPFLIALLNSASVFWKSLWKLVSLFRKLKIFSNRETGTGDEDRGRDEADQTAPPG